MTPSAAGLLAVLATLSASLFTAWAFYISLVEHPARLEAGAGAGRSQFRPSYRLAAVWQASFAAVALLSGAGAWALTSRWAWLAGGVLVGAVIPFTLVFIMPTTRRLLGSDPLTDDEVVELLRRWGLLHAVRTALGAAGLIMLLLAVAQRGS